MHPCKHRYFLKLLCPAPCPPLVCFFFLFILPFSFRAQNPVIDSLQKIISTGQEDTTMVNVLNSAAREVQNTGDYESALKYANNALQLSRKLRFRQGEGKACNNTGIIYQNMGNTELALKNYYAGLEIRKSIHDLSGMAASYNNIGNTLYSRGNYTEALQNHQLSLNARAELKDKKAMAVCYTNIGNCYFMQGNYSDALKNQLAALKIREEISDRQGIASCYTNIGNIYYALGNYKEALKNQLASLRISQELEDAYGIGSSYNNIGIIYYLQGNYEDALINQLASLKIRKQIGDKNGIAMSYSNIGIIYKNQENYSEALKNQYEALKIAKEAGDINMIANCYTGIGSIYTRLQKFREAAAYLDSGLQVSRQIGSKDYIRETYGSMAELDSARAASDPSSLTGAGKFWKASLENHKMYILYRDSLVNQETSKKLVESQMQYEFDKKESIARAQQEKKDALNAAERKRQAVITWFVSGLALLILVFAIFAYRNYLQKQKANNLLEEKNQLIENQKLVVEQKNHEITDSINYAKRIQQAILAPISEVYSSLPDSFILFKPKDIVSGDFYWYAEAEDGVLIAAADCTGHGVPGAIMSMLASDKLNEVLKQTEDVPEILSAVNRGIKKALRQSDKDGSSRDGMDIALLKISPPPSACSSSVLLEYAGANRPLWIIRKDLAGSALISSGKLTLCEGNLGEIKATKTAIGGLTDDDQRFGKHMIELQKGDTIYICTDGFADQFSAHQKKLKTKKFREILLSIQDKPMKDQETYLNSFIDSWRGEMEQTDDILVIGIRI